MNFKHRFDVTSIILHTHENWNLLSTTEAIEHYWTYIIFPVCVSSNPLEDYISCACGHEMKLSVNVFCQSDICLSGRVHM
jgi:hypothetical protein